MQSKALTPSVHWAQKKSTVFLTIMVRDLKNEKLTVTPTTIDFIGESNQKNYAFSFQFFDKIDQKATKMQKTGASLFIQLRKMQDSKWPRINKDQKRLGYVLVDWDRWDQNSDEQQQDTKGAKFHQNQNLAQPDPQEQQNQKLEREDLQWGQLDAEQNKQQIQQDREELYGDNDDIENQKRQLNDQFEDNDDRDDDGNVGGGDFEDNYDRDE